MASLYQKKKKGDDKPSGPFYIKMYTPGGGKKAKRIATRTTDRKAAQQMLDSIMGKVADGKPVHLKAHTVQFWQLCEAVISDYVVEGYATLGIAKRRFEMHIVPFFGAMLASAITSVEITNYKAKRHADGASKGTIRRELELVKRAFSLGDEAHGIRGPKMKFKKLKNARQGFFEEHDFALIMQTIDDQDYRDFLLFAYTTGWRSGEIKKLERRQIDMRNQCIRLDNDTKTDEARVFPMINGLDTMLARRLSRPGLPTDLVFTYMPATQSACEPFRASIERMLEEHQMTTTIFSTITATGFTGTYETVKRYVRKLRSGVVSKKQTTRRPIGDFQKAFDTACYRAGIHGCVVEPWSYIEPKSGKKFSGTRVLGGPYTPHDFRRTAIRNLTAMGVPESVAMQLCGHETAEVFRRYHIVAQTDLDIAAAKMNASFAPLLQQLQIPSLAGTGAGTVSTFAGKKR